MYQNLCHFINSMLENNKKCKAKNKKKINQIKYLKFLGGIYLVKNEGIGL